MNTALLNLFPKNYIVSRERFRSQLARVQAYWPNAELHHHALAEHPDLTIDWIRANVTEQPEKLLIITTGEHGAEGTVGAAMMQVFVEEYLLRLNLQDTGLLLVHAINPWGMQHNRRVNSNNVDLNRNFLGDGKTFTPAANPEYRLLHPFLNPQKSLRSKLDFLSKLIKIMFSPGQSALHSGMLMGQYEFPQGLYFGGKKIEEETRVMMDLYRKTVQPYAQLLHLDMHTGYGPRYQMSLVNSPAERRASTELEAAFNYPEVVTANPEEFYAIQGDMIDWIYELVQTEFPEKTLFATAFEFGTLGMSLPAAIRSLWAMIFENQVHWHAATNEAVVRRAKADFSALFSPLEKNWRLKAIADARQAFDGILRDQGFFL
ncbi:MAG: DUF2817 domain-containing protein [Chloroflexi bacterium]|nr:DUF2817 domain-containing protein [Chloroflexota bacterium]